MKSLVTVIALAVLLPASPSSVPSQTPQTPQTVAETLTRARAADGTFVSWREHLIDDVTISGVALSGSDGLVMADLDGDGIEDIVSVHESDTTYDGVAEGFVRIAFGSSDPDTWELVMLAEGAEAGAAEDAAIGDLNGDGYPDVVAACELAHLIYFENPGSVARNHEWDRLIPEVTKGRGSFIRVFVADLTGDGKLEVVTANKGIQNPSGELPPTPISWFEITGDPLDQDSWVEHELGRVRVPINAQPVDLDGDGDIDVLGGSMLDNRIWWFENDGKGEFEQHAIEILGTTFASSGRPPQFRDSHRGLVSGFNVDFADLNGDGRLDIVAAELFRNLVWLEQPADATAAWTLHSIGDIRTDQLVGLALADINGDTHPDIIVGGYSRGPRDTDGEVTPTHPLGRIAWFENPGDPEVAWARHDVSRRKRGMFDKFVPRDMDGDGDVDFVSTRGNSVPYDGVFWLEQVRTSEPVPVFAAARAVDSEQMPLPPPLAGEERDTPEPGHRATGSS